MARASFFVAALGAVLVASQVAMAKPNLAKPAQAGAQRAGYQRVAFADLPGWAADDHAAALAAFRQSCAAPPGDGPAGLRASLTRICAKARALSGTDVANRLTARHFFEANFRVFRLRHDRADGLFTGYFEPELDGALKPDGRFTVPILRRPDDLVDVVPASQRAAANAQGKLASMRKSGAGLVPYFTRAEIESGALAGRGLELVYLENPVDAHFLHIQGSGSIRLPDGRVTRIGFAGKNGYPFTSPGAVVIHEGIIPRKDLTMQTLRAWLLDHPEQAKTILQKNRSYIFFETKDLAQNATGPVGGHATPLTPGRSLAVDPSVYMLGAPVFAVAEGLPDNGKPSFHRLLVADDVGSAIGGAERGDIFWGTGQAAGEIAGRTKHRGHIYALLPRSQ